MQRLREKGGWTQAEVAERLGMSLTAYRNREAGVTRVRADEEEAIAAALETDATTLRRMHDTELRAEIQGNGNIYLRNRAFVGSVWDAEIKEFPMCKDGCASIPRLPGEDSPELFGIEIVNDSMSPYLVAGDVVVFSPFCEGSPIQSVDGCIAFVTLSEAKGGVSILAKMMLAPKSDDQAGTRIRLVKLNARFGVREVAMSDLDSIAIGVRLHRSL